MKPFFFEAHLPNPEGRSLLLLTCQQLLMAWDTGWVLCWGMKAHTPHIPHMSLSRGR